MKKLLLLLCLIGILFLVYAAAGPYRTVAGVERGIAQNDPVQLESYVDFEALRTNLKAQLRQRLHHPRQGRGHDMTTLASGFSSWVVDGLVDTLVTPSGLAMLMEGRGFWLTEIDGARHSTADEGLLHGARYGYDSLSRFSVRLPDQDVRLVLERTGLSWHLVDVQLK